jgi:hypothetical protein
MKGASVHYKNGESLSPVIRLGWIWVNPVGRTYSSGRCAELGQTVRRLAPYVLDHYGWCPAPDEETLN